VWRTPPPSRGAIRPRFASTLSLQENRGRRESRVRAAPAVSRAICAQEHAHEHTGSAESIRPSLRNGFTAYSALSPATNSSCHRRLRIDDLARPGWARKTSADLTSATDARTTRLRRTQPSRLRQRLRRGKPVLARTLNRTLAPSSCADDIAHGINPPCDSVSHRRCRVHRIPPRVS
jgi:hypothetical protein